ncbi:MAG: hypothetical protein HIU91_08425 [Acidobacteria bacterium]|nr:hypothetical protein [Acidobacteriota bacterium]
MAMSWNLIGGAAIFAPNFAVLVSPWLKQIEITSFADATSLTHGGGAS